MTTTVSLTTATVPQHMLALEQANNIRLARARLKAGIRSGTTTVAAVLRSPPVEAKTMTLTELLTSQRRWGIDRTKRLLSAFGDGIGEDRRLGAMSERQRRALAAVLLLRNPQGDEWEEVVGDLVAGAARLDVALVLREARVCSSECRVSELAGRQRVQLAEMLEAHG